MKNIYEANIILCEQMENGGSPRGIFNNIEIEKDDTATFDVGIFFVADVNQCGKEMFLLDIIYKDGGNPDTMPTNILGSMEKTYTSVGLNRELIVFKDNTVDFLWEGIYTLELRCCKECVDINEKSLEETIDILDNSTVVSSFTFSVAFKDE